MRKGHRSKPILFVLISIFIICAFGTVFPEEIEEAPDAVMPSDEIITGEISEHSGNSIVVDFVSFYLCESFKVFSPKNRLISYGDIDGAKRVMLFSNRKCIRKIKVLEFKE